MRNAAFVVLVGHLACQLRRRVNSRLGAVGHVGIEGHLVLVALPSRVHIDIRAVGRAKVLDLCLVGVFRSASVVLAVPVEPSDALACSVKCVFRKRVLVVVVAVHVGHRSARVVAVVVLLKGNLVFVGRPLGVKGDSRVVAKVRVVQLGHGLSAKVRRLEPTAKGVACHSRISKEGHHLRNVPAREAFHFHDACDCVAVVVDMVSVDAVVCHKVYALVASVNDSAIGTKNDVFAERRSA